MGSWPRPRDGSASAEPLCGAGCEPMGSGPTGTGAPGPRRAPSTAPSSWRGDITTPSFPLGFTVREAMPAKPYIIQEYVRWSDVDFAGIIFYGSYVRFFEIAETELFRACGLAYARVFDRYDIFLPRKAVHSEFYLPARLDDRLRVATYVGRVGTKSMTLNFDVLRDDPPRLGAAGWMVLVCVVRKSLKPQPLPPGLVEALAPHTLTTAAARATLGITPPPGARASL